MKKQKGKTLITIIIATFNSSKTLEMVLRSIKKQTISLEKVEIILVDGGSHDNTLKIAERYNCKVIKNTKTEPVYAKYLGYLNAKGRYVVYLDHDEVIENKTSLEKKYNTLKKYKNIKSVIGSGYKNAKNSSFVTKYINEFGDPFSFFIYKLSKDSRFFIKEMKKRYEVVSNDNDTVVFNLEKIVQLPIIELCAVGSMVDAVYMKRTFPETLENPELIPHFFYLLYKKSPHIAVTKNDSLIHYSSETYRNYLNKIKWRIKNNIHHQKTIGNAGFTGRDRYNTKKNYKKYLYIPYAYSIIFPLFDSLYLVRTRKDPFYLLHIMFTIYTATIILYNYLLKMLHIKPKLKSYDEKVEIDEK